MAGLTGARSVFAAGVWGPLRHAPGRTSLAVIAIALGVALGLAIHLVNRLAADEVSRAARSLFGMADLVVDGSGAGFDERLYPRIARLPGVAIASPVVQVQAKPAGQRAALTVLGMDAFRSRQLQPAYARLASALARSQAGWSGQQAVHLSAAAARSLNLQAGDVLRLQVGLHSESFEVAGVLPAAALQGRAGVMDIATAQWKFARLGLLSRIDLRLAPGANAGSVRRSIEELLPPGTRVVVPGQAADEAVRLSRAYRSNLTALALVALFTGGFFVFSTQSLAALRRRREFAVLHALGVTRRQQLGMTLLSGAVLGVAGAALGVLAGFAAANLGLQALGVDLGAGYFRDPAPALRLHWQDAAAFCVLGTAAAVMGSLGPALDAARIPTALALKSGDVASGVVRTRLPVVLALFAASLALLSLPPVADLPLPGYGAIALLIVGTVAAMPALLQWLLARAPRLPTVAWEIAIAQLRGTARYATLSVSAIVVSFSLMVAMAVMVLSFRTSLDAWTQKILPADLYLRAGYVGQSAYFDAADVARWRKLPGVARLETSRFAPVTVPGAGPLVLIARDLDPLHAERALWLERSTSTPPPSHAVPVWLSEAAFDLLGLPLGGMFQLPIAGRSVPVTIRGVWRDYEHSAGAIVIERQTYLRLGGDTHVNTAWLWLRPGATLAEVQRQLRASLPPDAEYDLRTPRELRHLSLQAFDRTFAVTYVIELLAIVIGLFGIAAGTSAQVLARRGEFGVLRHIGVTRGQIAALLAIEGAGLGALGAVAGLGTGTVVGTILVYVVNRQSFHWSMDLSMPFGTLAALSGALIASAALIAVLSGRQALRADVVGAVKEDW